MALWSDSSITPLGAFPVLSVLSLWLHTLLLTCVLSHLPHGNVSSEKEPLSPLLICPWCLKPCLAHSEYRIQSWSVWTSEIGTWLSERTWAQVRPTTDSWLQYTLCVLGPAPALAEPWSPPLPHGVVHSPLLAALFGTSTVALRKHCSWSSHHPMSSVSGPSRASQGPPLPWGHFKS